MTEKTLTLPAGLCEAVNAAMAELMPMLVTYWDEKGAANTSWRGSAHARADGHLAMWVRSRQGGLQKAIQTNPKIALAYRNPRTNSFVTFTGQARLETAEAGNAEIFKASPPSEQAADPDRKGVGVVIRLERVCGALDGRNILIEA